MGSLDGMALRYRVTGPERFDLDRHHPGDVASGLDKTEGHRRLERAVRRLSDLQELFAAQRSHALLLVFQAPDAGGKDGTIRHVMSGVNPQGVQVHSFKQPSAEERGHDFLWRIHKAVPGRGVIGIFNRSHYEDVLTARVHAGSIADEDLPGYGKNGFWTDRLSDIAAFEAYLARQGVVILKFFLNISQDEQRQRLLDRVETGSKRWKLSASDLEERQFWPDYRSAYRKAIAATAAPHAPWFVVPANHKWFARLVVIEAIIEAMEALDLSTPEPDEAQVKLLAHAREVLKA